MGRGATAELARKKSVASQFSALQKARGTAGQNERVLAFYASLDPHEDLYFVQAAEQDLQLDRAGASRQARAGHGARRGLVARVP